jgi:serine protease Do
MSIMKSTMQILATLAVVITAMAIPSFAQPGGQPYILYSEEPWGGGSYLGVDARDVTPDRLNALHLKEERGVEVTLVDQDAPAGKAGVKEHDVILTINSQSVESVEQLVRMIHEIPAGRSIDIGISRDGQLSTLKAQLVERNKTFGSEREFNWATPPVPPVPAIPAINIPKFAIPEMDFQTVVVMRSPVRSGLMVENLTPQLGDFFGAKNGVGVLVRSVEKGSRAEAAGFHAGDVILKVNGTAVNDCSDFTRLLKGHTENKASVTVLRDRKELNVTITLPQAKQSGAVSTESKCEDTDNDSDNDNADDACASIVEIPEVAMLAPEMAEATAELKRLQPELEQLKKQVRVEVQNHRVDIQKDVEKAQKELIKQQKEIRIEMKQFAPGADI